MKENGYDSEEQARPSKEANRSTSYLEEEEREMLLPRSQKFKASRSSTNEETGLEENEEKTAEDKKIAKKKTPWWASSSFWVFRKAIAPILMVVMLLTGLYIGYVIVGGQSAGDVFRFETWKHLWDLIFADV